ncbi:heme-thiolate peroxidase [Auricularia subglabra TFB-10046 SS5]|uniref:Heme-thiolate peroxidase n=1 Tax=Auricularia subglabra (strain TFB-10046 / SS5) TaxID=717982 RepID=J0WQR6_AURST|nr:heme-thiolate peroxidase [Auricularia subglabra TFB-10046 SS5]
MFSATLFIFASALSVGAFPSFGDPAAVRRGLQAMSKDAQLVTSIRALAAEQRLDIAAWSGNDIVGRLLNGTLDLVNGVVDTLPSSIEGSKRFPEDAYPFIAPGPTDQRGPCPGMNTLANHGYVPRNGIVTVLQTIHATSQLFNMAVDLSTALTAGALALNGDIPTLTFSIGGADPRTNSLGMLGGLLGTETGLDGHGRVNEGDASASRCDFYLCAGDNHNMQPKLFRQMLDRAHAHGNLFTVASLQEHFHNRYAHSRANNPSFYFVPPSALIVMGATYFHAGFFTNGTIGNGGSANIASISSFNGARITDSGDVLYVPERRWYRRVVPMTLLEALAGILSIYLNPYPVAFGGNAGSTDKFVPGPGLLALPTDAENPNGLGCFLYNALYADFVGELDNLLLGLEDVLNGALGLLDPAFADFVGCKPNYPDETDSNQYNRAKGYLNATSHLPGAPKKQPCLGGARPECGTSTNKYASAA